MKLKWIPLLAVLALIGCTQTKRGAADPLAEGFRNPPEQTKPWCYWYWISDNISKEGITRDLEAMAHAGIGEALIGNIFLDEVPAGNVKVLSPEWWGMVEHAIREGGRVGVNIGLFNCPGWSQSGGPWIKPEQTMRYVASSETRVTGPKKFSGKLPAPKEHFQDIALLAFPAPKSDTDAVSRHSPRVACIPAAPGADKLVDGKRDTVFKFPQAPDHPQEPFIVEISLAKPFTARSVQIHPTLEAFGAECELQAADADGKFQAVRRFKCDRSNPKTGVGFIPDGPVAASFPAVTSRKFRVVFDNYFKGFWGPGKSLQLAEIELSGAARLESYIEKQLAKMHPTPLPLWDTYLWPATPEPEAAELAVPPAGIVDLAGKMSPDGTLAWDVPAGEWIILRAGMTPTGMKNAPASPEGRGLEVDKMNRELATQHFNAFVGELVRRMPAEDRKAFKQVVADSYEMGSQNWTDGLAEDFAKRYGYDPKPWLPVLTGRIVGSADQSDRFLWDLRRLVADRVATDYVGGLRDASREHGLGLWLENYGHWGFPGEFLKYGGQSDRIGGEFWVTGDLGSIECRAASSCANIYGKPFVSAESFTGGPPFQSAPGALKRRGDWSFCEGVNHVVLHVYIHQPWEDKIPGVNAPWGTEFNRHNTWFERAGEWIGYERRCCWLLQQGWRVADVAYFIGEDAPKMTGVRNPPLPEGYDFDYINAEVIENSLGVAEGVLTLPHGTSHRVLVLPQQDALRPALLRKIRDLVRAGATVIGPAPVRSPSLAGFPACDDEVRALARELWGESPGSSGERAVGKGRIVWGKGLDEVLASLGVARDFQSSEKLLWTHRRDGGTDIYFVTNPKAEAATVTAAFRAGGRLPEIWRAESGAIEKPAVFDESGGHVRLPLHLGPHGSAFVVFRESSVPGVPRVVSVARDGNGVLGTQAPAGAEVSTGDAAGNFTVSVWVRPDAETALTAETDRGAEVHRSQRNDLLAPPHGEGLGGPGAAGFGLAVGRNGVSVLEHGANHFTAPLVHAVPVVDWTHLAVVYRGNRPHLYVNGQPARDGLQSPCVVHSGTGTGLGAQFRGVFASFQQQARALDDAEVLALARQPPALPGGALPPVVTRAPGGGIQAEVEEAGVYQLCFSDTTERTLDVSAVPAPVEVAGPWEVSFASGPGAPEKITFDRLTDWTQRPEGVIRYFSGKAVYKKTVTVPKEMLAGAGSRLLLDLGEVRDLATVRVNGREFATLWIAPWRVDVTGAVKPGANELEIEVINPWNNRLAGDAALPREARRTVLMMPTVKQEAPLMPAGLIGPVHLRVVRVIPVK